jgi:methyl-accepting chemotaxis protein
MDALRDLVDHQIMKHGKEYRDSLNELLKWEDEDVKRNSDAAHEAKKAATTWIIVSWISAISLGGILGFIILKNIMADQNKTEKLMAEAVRSFNVLESSPSPTMMCTPDGTLLYINKSGTETFRKLQQFLPQNVDDLVGKSMDTFHKNPKMVKDLIANPKNLPYKAVISVGPEKMDLLVTASVDEKGNYLGAAVTWGLITERVALIDDLTIAAENLSTAATNVLSISTNLSAGAEETSAQANTASVASEEVNAGVQTVANNMEEMVSAIKEITKTTNEAASMTQEAMKITKSTNEIINKLGESSMDIGNVIKVISSIAQQTNLLALNATIEAARAGEAGKGFAVVANEVKELANQTAKATNEITKKIETIQADSKNAVDAIGEITHAIEKVNGFTSNIAASVEEQAATTNEVTRIVTEAAQGVKQISENIQQVSQAASSTGKDAIGAQGAAKGVGDISVLLKKYVERLKVQS